MSSRLRIRPGGVRIREPLSQLATALRDRMRGVTARCNEQ